MAEPKNQKAGPSLLYGTAWKKEKTADLVFEALRQGFRGVDTACQPRHYQEKLVGQGLQRARYELNIERSELFIQTKFTPPNGQDLDSIPYDVGAPIRDQVEQSLKVSLDNLATDYIDSLVLHSPYLDWADSWEAWLAMEKAVSKGDVRQIGISNCYDYSYFVRLHESANVKPAVLQNRFYQDAGYDVRLRGYCKKHGVTYQSFWTLTANPHILQHPHMDRICQDLSATPAQVLFNYLMQAGCQPLTGTSSVEHMQEDLQAIHLKLSNDHVQQLELIAKMAIADLD